MVEYSGEKPKDEKGGKEAEVCGVAPGGIGSEGSCEGSRQLAFTWTVDPHSRLRVHPGRVSVATR